MLCTNYNKISYKQIIKPLYIFKAINRNLSDIKCLQCPERSLKMYGVPQLKNKLFYKYINCALISYRRYGISNVNKENKKCSTENINIQHYCFYSTCKPSLEVEQLYYVDNEENRETGKLYPSPKNKLHSILTLVCEERKNKGASLRPSFKCVQDQRGSKWICSYKLDWPVEINFLAKDTTKKVASHKAALAALTWLRKQNKISKDGSPIIYNKDEIKKLTKENIQTISLNQNSIDSLDNVIRIYEEKMLPHIIKNPEPSQIPDDHKYSIKQELEFIPVNKKFLGLERYKAKEQIRLPITDYKEHFTQSLQKNQVLIVKGEPGCGKSTRIPQYVLEAWAKEDGLLGKPGMIAVTQPRRIAAISLANRVSSERKEPAGMIVGHQVRLNSNFRPATGRILYCTTGILLRHVQTDSALSHFSHIILDEVHERDVNTDLLMNLLRITLKNNPALKLIVMSATIDTDKFRKYYNDAPVIEIPGFTYPVQSYFLESCSEVDLSKTLSMMKGEAPSVVHNDVLNMIKHIHSKKPEGAILCFLPGWEDIRKIEKQIPHRGDLTVHCLHSRLNDSEQYRIFSKPPPGVRKIILATNIAETSVTVDDVVYVIDTGIHKEQIFDTEKGIKCIDNRWISKASAIQRRGRAGRVQPGECYHLYTKSKYDSFEEYSPPEITRTSLTKIVLDSKAFSNNMDTLEFMKSLPTPPEEGAISRAVEELKELDLLDENENLTTLGRTLAEFQLEPKLSKTLVNSHVFMCSSPVVDIVTLFSTDTEIFSSGLVDKETIKHIKSRFSLDSDHLALMRMFEKYLDLVEDHDFHMVNKFCDDLNLIPHRMKMLSKLRTIHWDYLKNGLHEVLPFSDRFSDNVEFVKAVLYSGIGNILQYRNWDIVKQRLKNNKSVLVTRNNHKATITPESVNYRRDKYPSNYLLYINETRSNIRRTTLVRECSFLSNLSVLLFSNKNLSISEVHNTNLENKTDMVKIALNGTNIDFLCNQEQAQKIFKCKEIIKACYCYYTLQLTSIGDNNEEVNSHWSDMLHLLNNVISNNVNNKN